MWESINYKHSASLLASHGHTNLNCVVLPCYLQASWISVDFDNWRDWENEEDDGKEEYDRYMDVSDVIR